MTDSTPSSYDMLVAAIMAAGVAIDRRISDINYWGGPYVGDERGRIEGLKEAAAIIVANIARARRVPAPGTTFKFSPAWFAKAMALEGDANVAAGVPDSAVAAAAPFAWFHTVPWNELAVVLDSAYENYPPGWFKKDHKAWSDGFVTALTEQHRPDCSEDIATCRRCHAEWLKGRIDAMRAALKGPTV